MVFFLGGGNGFSPRGDTTGSAHCPSGPAHHRITPFFFFSPKSPTFAPNPVPEAKSEKAEEEQGGSGSKKDEAGGAKAEGGNEDSAEEGDLLDDDEAEERGDEQVGSPR